MKIVFYISKATDEITSFHPVDPGWTEQELSERVDSYNKSNQQNTVVVVTADKYMEFLCNKATEKATYRKEALEEICNMLEQAKDCVEALK